MKVLLVMLAMVCCLQTVNAKDVVLTSRNHCALESQVDDNSMQELKFCLADKALLRRGRRYPIYLVVNSPGGGIYAGMRFIEFAKTIKNIETVSIFAASMASAIVEALPGKRHVTENGVLMFHRAKGQFSGQFEDGEVESRLVMWKKIVRKMEKANSGRIGITLKEYKDNVKDEWWIFGKDNVTQKTVDVVSVVKCSAKLLRQRTTKTVRGLFSSYEVTVSGCPLAN